MGSIRPFHIRVHPPSLNTPETLVTGHMASDLIWGEATEADGEEGHEAEVECVEERPGLDTRHKHSAAGDIAGEKVRLKERKN